MYASDLATSGIDVKLIIEGKATKCFNWLKEQTGFKEIFDKVSKQGLIVGACDRASNGCSSSDKENSVANIVTGEGLKLLCDLNGHAGITRYLKDGYIPVIF